MSRNREIAEVFAAQFDPPLAVVQTQRINNVPYRDAWVCAVYDEALGYGVTAHVFHERVHAYVEANASTDPVHLGKVMAAVLGRLKQDEPNAPDTAEAPPAGGTDEPPAAP